jgi:aldehyde dehydrogenase (NAD+)
LRSLYDDACNKGARVLVGGNFNESERFIDPTLIGQVTDEMDIMQEEIFGPLLPSMIYRDRNEVLDIINWRPKPLTIYISSKNHNNIDYFIEGTSAGGTVINDYMLGYSNPNLPFGGINNSGIGKSMGFHGFIQFSNERSVIRRKWGSMDMIYPPYNDRIRWLIKSLYRWF